MALLHEAFPDDSSNSQKGTGLILTQDTYGELSGLKIIHRVAALDTLERVLCEIPRDIHGVNIRLVDAPFDDKELVLYLDRSVYFGAFTGLLGGVVITPLLYNNELEGPSYICDYFDSLAGVLYNYSSRYTWRHEKFMFKPLDYHKSSVDTVPYECFHKDEKEMMTTAANLLEMQDDLLHKCVLPRDVINKICMHYGVRI